jgi:hypothetical protein
MSARDYHAQALQQYRMQLELARATARASMVRGDRRDATVMDRAAFDSKESRMLPRDRVLMDLADLREYDRLRERSRLTLEPEGDKGRVWP